MADLTEIDRAIAGLLRQLGPSERRRLLNKLARDIQRRQSARIGEQRDPDGGTFAPRRPKAPAKPGNYALKFLYPKDDPHPRVAFLKAWVHQGPIFTGYDIEAGGIRSFFWDRVAKWLPVEREDQNKSAGKLRRRGAIRRAAMFRRLRRARFLRAGASADEAWAGFQGRAAEIASVSQDGLEDRPAPKAKPVRYPRRRLLGMTRSDMNRATEVVLDHFLKFY